MAGRFSNNPFVNEQEDPENSPENSCDSPRYSKTSPSSHQTSRRSVQKKVVSVPIRDVEGSRLKGETPPPSDSWAWRKYGQKPIKGSPYPRGYYRCSSSKGCPARKQVERSRVDPTMLVVTYSSDHNHAPPTSKNHHHRNSPVIATAAEVEITAVSTTTPPLSHSDEENNSTVFDLGDESLVSTFGFKWFSELESSTSSTMLESPILEGHGGETDVGAMIFSMREEEDESLFADLGELPECSVVFRRAALEREEEERRRCNLAPWCGTTR